MMIKDAYKWFFLGVCSFTIIFQSVSAKDFHQSSLFALKEAQNEAKKELEEPSNSQSILDIITNDPSYSLFAKALEVTGLLGTLQEKDQLTVLVPNNKAFQNAPPELMKELESKEESELLKELIQSHIILNTITSKELAKKDLKTLNGNTLKVSVKSNQLEDNIHDFSLSLSKNDPNDLFLVDNKKKIRVETISEITVQNAKITKADLTAANGIIHEVDTVILPLEKNGL